MEFSFFTNPVTFCIIKNFYTGEEVNLIHKELDEIYSNFKGAEATGSSVNIKGDPRKQNKGLFLDDFYGRNRDKSAILNLNRKTFHPQVKYELVKGNWFFSYIERTKYDSTLVSTYSQGDYYSSHSDQSFITAIYYTWKEPKQFEGGELYFGEFKVPIENNCMLLFPSCTEHQVKPVTRGYGRFAISQFISLDNPPVKENIRRVLNFLTINEFDKVNNLIDNLSWSKGSSVGGSQIFGNIDLNREPYITDVLVNKIRSTLGMNLHLNNVYANGQFFGQDGVFHQDNTSSDAFTVVLYMNRIEDADIDIWGGETQFKIGERITSYQPYTNSLLIFNSNLVHRGMAPSRYFNDRRVTITWKFTLDQ